MQGGLREELRPHDARVPVAEIPALEERGRGVHLDLAGVQQALEVAAVDRIADQKAHRASLNVRSITSWGSVTAAPPGAE